ncbi:MAG: alpha-glucosidase C-terminal domain-containing protein [Myxococcales bacterium]|nr:alpha-glucosidase C-terminal domain-containing protein [Myxococcales bacterium]
MVVQQFLSLRGAGRLAWLVLIAWCGVQWAGCVKPESVLQDDRPLTNHVDDWRDEVIYQLMTDRFADGDPNNNYNVNRSALARYQGGDWRGIIDKLDYLKSLGVTTLWISPVVKNLEEDAGVAGYHGYWTQDFMSVNPHFGDPTILRKMIDAAHDAGLKVIFDIVINHIGQLFYYDMNLNGQPDISIWGSGKTSPVQHFTEWDPDYDPRGVQAFTSLGESGPAPIIWVYDPTINRMPPLPIELQNPDWYNRRGRVTNWDDDEQVIKGDFPGGLKDLDTSRADVQQVMVRIFAYWIGTYDFDGYRIDTLKHVEHEFWRVFAPAMRQFAKSRGKNKFFMFGEAFDGRDELVGSFTKNNEVDSVFNFPHKFQVFDGVFKYNQPTENIRKLYDARTTNYGTAPHPDGIGVAPTAALVNFLDNHDVPRFLYDKPSVPALHSALFYLLTMDGIPCIYYGTEQQFNGGNDPANREPLWRSGYDTTNPTFQHIAKLTALRKLYPPLRRGSYTIVKTSLNTGSEEDAGIFAFERSYEGETMLVVFNVSDTQTSQTAIAGDVMKTSFSEGSRLVEIFNGDNESVTIGADGAVTIAVGPRGGKIFVLEGKKR